MKEGLLIRKVSGKLPLQGLCKEVLLRESEPCVTLPPVLSVLFYYLWMWVFTVMCFFDMAVFLTDLEAF